MNKEIVKFLVDKKLNSIEARDYFYNLPHLQLKHPSLGAQIIKLFLNMTRNLKSLYLETPGFNQFPDGIQKLEQVEDFSFTKASLFGKDFKNLFLMMPNLKKMSLFNFVLNDLPDDLPILPQMQALDFVLPQETGNQLEKILAIVPNLKRLVITCDNFSALSNGIVRLKHLETLNLQRPVTGEDFKKLMDIMPNVKTIYGVNITSPIPDSISTNNKLEMITLSGTLTNENFKKIAIRFPHIKTIQAYLQDLAPPEDLSQMEHLEYFSLCTPTLAASDFKKLADKMPNIITLKLDCPNIEQIPDNFPVLKRVEELILSCSIITGDVFKQLLAKLPKVKRLYLGASLNSSQIPDHIPNLQYLESLYIDIKSLDDDNLKKLIAMMPNLKKISFDNPNDQNLIDAYHAIPDELPSLANVEVIDWEESIISGNDLRRVLLKTDPRNLHEIKLNDCQFSNIDLRMGEFKFTHLKKLDLFASNVGLNDLLVLVAATTESKLLKIDIYKNKLIEMLQGSSLWAKVILVGAFPQYLLEEFTTKEEYKYAYRTLLASKLIGTYEQQNLFITNHHPNETDTDYQLFQQYKNSFEHHAAKYWQRFSGTIAMIPYKVVMGYINTEGALLELLASKNFVMGDVEKIAAYDIFAQLYLQYTIDSLKKSAVQEVIESSRRGRDRLYQGAITINNLLRQDECYEKLEQCKDISEFFQTLFNELFSLVRKPYRPQAFPVQTNPRKKLKISG